MSGFVTQTPKPLRDPQKYKIAIICALTNEATAVQSAFDHQFYEEDEVPETLAGDLNCYDYGVLSGYYVVLAQLGRMGNNEAATVAVHLQRTYPSIKLCLLVGICGIVPYIKSDEETISEALLGDVVISKVIKQYDFGKDYPTGFVPTNLYPQATAQQRRLYNQLERPQHARRLATKTWEHLKKLDTDVDMKSFGYPGWQLDHLYKSDYRHEHQHRNCTTCMGNSYCENAAKTDCSSLGCSPENLITDRKRIADLQSAFQHHKDSESETNNIVRLSDLDEEVKTHIQPKVFLGDVASGDKVMKNGVMREQNAKQHNVIAFEMEGAGIWENLPVIVIKSGCDYADSHKNKRWQKYACMTAAACAKAFLEVSQIGFPQDVEYSTKIEDKQKTEPDDGVLVDSRSQQHYLAPTDRR